MSSDAMSHDEAIGQFCGVTGADEERAKGLLEACDWNLELAINMHVDTDDGRGNKQGAFKAGTSAALDGASTSNAAQVVDVNADDDDDIKPTFGPSIRDTDQQSSSSNQIDPTTSADYVRPPIRPIRQVLVQSPMDYTPEPPRGMARRGRYNTRAGNSAISDVYDAFRDFQAEARWQEMAQEGESSSAATLAENKRRTLQDIFRPPLELMFRGSMVSAREVSQLQNKWLLVNIQDSREFPCQILNRDVWSNQAVKDILKEHFIFWQVYYDSFEGNRYVQFYNVTKYPHVSIIDPRTGELVKSWPTSIDHTLFCDSAIEFLTEHPSPDGSGEANTMKKLRVKDDDEVSAPRTLYDQSEEAQLEAAIKASLQESDENKTIDLDDSSESSSMFDRLDRRMDDVLLDKHRSTGVDGQMSSSSSSFSKHFDSSNRAKNGNLDDKMSSDSFVHDTNISNSANKLNSFSNSGQATNSNSIRKTTYRRPTPPPGMECRIALRFPDGTSTVQKFSSQELLSDVKLFVQVEKETADDCEIEFIAPPNKKLTESMMCETLENLGLCPASRLEVKYA